MIMLFCLAFHCAPCLAPSQCHNNSVKSYVLHCWLAFLTCPVESHVCYTFALLFVLHFLCIVFLHLGLVLLFPCLALVTLNSYYVRNKSQVLLLCLVLEILCLASWAWLSTICLSTLLSITPLSCIFDLFILPVNSNVYPYILHLCLLPLACPSQTFFASLACVF